MTLSKLHRQMEVHPSWAGKAATVLQIICILWVLLRIPAGIIWLASLASLLTIVSGFGYFLDFIRRERVAGRS